MAEERDTILDSIADGVFTVDGEWHITSFNRAAERITGVSREKAVGKTCSSVFRSSICEKSCALRHTIDTGREVVNKTIDILNADGGHVPVSISTALLRDRDGRVVGGVETFRDLSAVETLRKELRGRYTDQDIVSRSHRMREIFDVLPAAAASESTALIEGESGTGKELLARAIHNLSPRAAEPIVTVNCGALPDTLLEAELFGYKAGAFTDAKRDKPGRFAMAEGGTLFLDEIGDVSPAMQVRLLRILQEKTYEPLGATEVIHANVRILAATHRDLSRLVAEGGFRQDLYYRINVLRIALPPLRERKEDIPLLVEHFIRRFNRLQGKNVTGVTDGVLSCLMSHDFPGNIRELENVLEHAFVLCHGGMIEPKHLPEPLRSEVCRACPESRGASTTLEEMERVLIQAALRRNKGKRHQTARDLGIDRSTLRRKMVLLNIEIPARRGRPPKDQSS